LFGASGSANFLSRATGVLALVFFLTSLTLTYLSSRRSDDRGVMADQPATRSIPGQTPAQTPSPAPAPGRAAPVPAAPAEGGRAQEVPK
jgi:preprotein translocase subunit SecG